MTQAAYTLDGAPCSRQAFYAVACDPARNVAVQACAGAGKTWMLVSRILRILLDGMQAQDAATTANAAAPPEKFTLRTAPQEILAITFTKKAAGEMRERLHDWLAEFSSASPERLAQELVNRGFSKEIACSPAYRLQSLLSNLYQTLLDDGRTVQIRTFHSWFSALLRNAPLQVLQDLQLPPNYELLEDDSQARLLVWPRFYAALQASEPLHQIYCQVVAQHGRSNTEKALNAALSKRVEFALADAAGAVERSVRPFAAVYTEFAGLDAPLELLSANRDQRQKLRDAALLLGRATQKTFAEKGAELEAALTAGDLQAAMLVLLTKDKSARKFNDKVDGIAQIRVAQDLCLRIVAAQNQDEAWQHQHRMAQLARALIGCFSGLKRERGWVDMGDVERAALHLLSDSVLSGWVQQRLDAQIKHVLIDEFQDTNPLQWQALSAWLGGYAGAGGGSSGGQAPSLFIVGDPKQSIYRFRRAEPQVFVAAMAFVRDAFGGAVLSCDHTRRNTAAVLGAVNATLQRAQEERGYDGFRQHTTESDQTGAVLQLPPIARDAADAAAGPEAQAQSQRQDSANAAGRRDSLVTPRHTLLEPLHTLECRQAAQWIAQQLQAAQGAQKAQGGQGTPPASIMVLARKRDRLQRMKAELQALGIAAQIGEKTELIDHCEVQDIVALVDALVSTGHDLSLARALKSPLFGGSDKDLLAIALQAQRLQGSWWSVLQNKEQTIEWISRQTADFINKSATDLRQYQAWLAALPPHDALQRIYHHGDVVARFAAAAPATARAAVVANLQALLAASLEVAGGRFLTPYAWVRALKAGGITAPALGAVSEAAPSVVQLFTIHGAKGLEADTVLILDTDSPATRAPLMDVLIDWPAAQAAPVLFAFLASEASAPRCVAAALQVESAARAREETNALYVAMTRAKTTLAFSSVVPHAADPISWWSQLQNAQPWTAPVLTLATAWASAPIAAQQALPTFNMKIMPFAGVSIEEFAIKSEATADISPSAAEAARIGQAMHQLLQWYAPLSSPPGNAVASSAASSVASAQTVQSLCRQWQISASQAQSAALMAEAIVAGEAAWAWDATQVDWQANEVEIWHEQRLQRIDRLVRRRAQAGADSSASSMPVWWVLDYKSAAQPERSEALRLQMQAYVRAVQAAQPGEPVRAAFITGQGRMVPLD